MSRNTIRNGTAWMQTFTGRQFYPMNPLPQEVDIIDIAHSLSMQCRYNGHVHRFMSVAEHCVLVSQLVEPQHALWGLLHDATEAYVGDMIRPLKLHMPQFREAEDRVMQAIAERFGITPQTPRNVHEVDSRILLDERAALFDAPAGEWNVAGEPFGVHIPAWSPRQAEAEYLTRFTQLTSTVASPATGSAAMCAVAPVSGSGGVDGTDRGSREA